MSEQTPTIKIKTKPCPGNEEGVLIINESDFDPKRHERYDESEKPKGEDGAAGKSEKGDSKKKEPDSGKAAGKSEK